MNRLHKTLIGATLLAILAVVTITRANAQITTLRADMTNAGESVPVTPTFTAANGGGLRPASFGTAIFTLDQTNPLQPFMTFTATIFNIDFTGTQTADTNDNLTVAHIHASPTVTATTNAPVVWGFIGTPLNDTNPNDVVVTPFTNAVGGTVSGKWDVSEGQNTTLTAQLPNILTGRSYMNFHTTQFGGGEVRAFLVVVPEASTFALALPALALVGAVILKRRKGA